MASDDILRQTVQPQDVSQEEQLVRSDMRLTFGVV